VIADEQVLADAIIVVIGESGDKESTGEPEE